MNFIICPLTHSPLIPDSEYKTLKNENGYTFEIKNFIPVLLSDQEKHDFDYATHYAKDAELFDYFEERSGGTEHDERRVREYILSKIPLSAKTVLDVGCGRAWIAKELINQKDFVCSLDISLTNPDKALELYPSENHAGLVADALNLPFADNSFDCIVTSEVIEHIEEADKFIAELFRCVKPGGKLIITTPYKEIIKYYLCIHCNKPTPVNAHLHSFDEKKLETLYSGNDLAGFEWHSFGNKVLLHLRAHVILKFFPFWLWKLKDSMANFFINKRAHILAIYTKKNG
jgi:ubiquinone/menaquinone biosynthesis C-methylase UbiE